MESIKNIFKIGNGPSSSHTMGPKKAAEMFRGKIPEASSVVITLYGSLAATGVGHLTDKAILNVFEEEPKIPASIIWKPEQFLPQHPNGMKFEAFSNDGTRLFEWITFSIGGGDISDSGTRSVSKSIYPHSTMNSVLDFCIKEGVNFWEYVDKYEDENVWDYLREVWIVMKNSIA